MSDAQRAALELKRRRLWQGVSDAELLERARAERAALVASHGEDAARELELEVWNDSTTLGR